MKHFMESLDLVARKSFYFSDKVCFLHRNMPLSIIGSSFSMLMLMCINMQLLRGIFLAVAY